MNKLLIIILTLLASNVFGQKNPNEEAQPIVAEGKLLYKSEMASWYGTDLFIERYKNRDNIGGYFSYIKNDISKCIFFSASDNPKVIGTISFDETYNVETAKVDLSERTFTKNENDLYVIRKIAISEFGADTSFKRYNNTNVNFIPIISRNERKVYVLTAPTQSGVVIFGNDYLFRFDKKNKLKHKKALHSNIIPIDYDIEEEGAEVEGAIHNHSPETGDFITATDICTLMLYEKFAKWKKHHVVSKKYLNIWNCETDELMVIPMDIANSIDKGQGKQVGKKNKEK